MHVTQQYKFFFIPVFNLSASLDQFFFLDIFTLILKALLFYIKSRHFYIIQLIIYLLFSEALDNQLFFKIFSA